jgi:hypothetical protein
MSDTAILSGSADNFKKFGTFDVYLVEPTTICIGCPPDTEPPPAVSDVVSVTIDKPAGTEQVNVSFSFSSDPDVPSKLPSGAVTLTENGLDQHLEGLLFSQAGIPAGAEPFVVIYKSCSCSVPEPSAFVLVGVGLLSLLVGALGRGANRAPCPKLCGRA